MEEREIKRCICSKCGTKGEVIIFHRFGVEERRMAETGALFQWKCSSCGALYRFIYPCLYINDKKKLAVRYRGEGKDFDFALDLTGYCKRDCNSMEEISEKIRILEAGLDDRVMELLKLLTFAKLHIDDDSMEKIYFYRKNEIGNIEFTIFRGKEPDGIEVPKNVYANIEELATQIPALPDEFVKIDLNWAGRQVTDY